ncbi:hypothetical protein TWF132_011167 [Orbilia oligospora]|uniref:Uncharacterized protein n=1 Tax=Orbilia oligospora TaxID=2813651 RepID=A0A7C8P6U5_ORBOL|nr:hypothetical protein TWF751_002510 [Orbilia oligospora]KAF3278568.1 hypothetical protein TWF970_004572 [Orbilia oligospora]KAF3281755.1 hypothetical protein TWF132_011167 [Orbilia oligospora]
MAWKKQLAALTDGWPRSLVFGHAHDQDETGGFEKDKEVLWLLGKTTVPLAVKARSTGTQTE